MRLAVADADPDASKGRVPLAERRAVLDRQRGSRREEPAEDAVEVGAARGGPGLHDGEPVRREDERRDLCAQLLRGPQRRAVQLRLLALAAAEGQLELQRPLVPRPAQPRSAPHRSPKRISSPSDRVRGEKPCVATWSASSRFVFPTPFRPDDEDDPRLERELQPLVGAIVAEREAGDDQPARRIGMRR